MVSRSDGYRTRLLARPPAFACSYRLKRSAVCGDGGGGRAEGCCGGTWGDDDDGDGEDCGGVSAQRDDGAEERLRALSARMCAVSGTLGDLQSRVDLFKGCAFL